MIRIAVSLLAVGLALFAVPAQAEITQCTNITSLPTTISTQGVYCLKQDLATGLTSGPAINITVNNVTLNCNDWKVGGLAGGPDTNATGIYANNRKNITIRNCGIRGFRLGINLSGSDSAYGLIENNRIDLSTERGMIVWGDGLTVRGNRIYDTGGKPDWESHAISMIGNGDITDNTVMGVTPSNASGLGIFVNASRGSSLVARNTISGVLASGTRSSTGIHGWNQTVIRDNTVFNNVRPLTAAYTGIYCRTTRSIVTGNAINGFANPATPISVDCSASENTVL